jgi:hypothetical protein
MVGIAGDLHQLAVFDVVEKRARIGAVLRAGASDDTSFAHMDGHGGSPEKKPARLA